MEFTDLPIRRQYLLLIVVILVKANYVAVPKLSQLSACEMKKAVALIHAKYFKGEGKKGIHCIKP